MNASASIRILVITGLTFFCLACSGGDEKKPLQPLRKIFNGEPANFDCLGSFSDPPSQNVPIGTSFDFFSETPNGAEMSPDTRAVVFDPATDTTGGTVIYSDAEGRGFLSASDPGALHDSTRYHFRVIRPTGASPYVETYSLGVLTPIATVSSNLTLQVRVIPASTYLVFLGLLYIRASDVADTTQVAGGVDDCDGALVENAYIEAPGPGGDGLAKLCDEGEGVPCIAYFSGDSPNKKERQTTSPRGYWLIPGVPPDVDYTVKSFGIVEEGSEPIQIGQYTMKGRVTSPCPLEGGGTCSVSLLNTSPMPGAAY